jgi:hypothetical protein
VKLVPKIRRVAVNLIVKTRPVSHFQVSRLSFPCGVRAAGAIV